MSTVRAGSHMLWWSFAKLDPAVAWPFARENILVDGQLVWMYGSSTFPACKVHAVSYSADYIKPFNTPLLICSVFMGPRRFGALEMVVDIGGIFHEWPRRYLSRMFCSGRSRWLH